MECFEIVNTVQAAIQAAHTPNVRAVACRLAGSGGISVQQQFIQYARTCIQPGIDYFQLQLQTNLKDSLLAFKSARFFAPQKICTIQPDANAISALSAFPFFSTEVLDGQKVELPSYLARVTDVDPNLSCLEWWKLNNTTLPLWSEVAQKILLVQPSSAASERVFSLLNASFSYQQQSSLQDYVETSVMMQYNGR